MAAAEGLWAPRLRLDAAGSELVWEMVGRLRGCACCWMQLLSS